LKTVLFYIRITNDKEDDVIRVLVEALDYILKTQLESGKEVVGVIYVEKWV